MATYVLRDETGADSEPFDASSDAEARRLARERVGEWADPDAEGRTVWARETLVRLGEDGAEEETLDELVVALHPAETCSAGGEHRWIEGRRLAYLLLGGVAENPGVWGHGGGVQISEVCARCGRKVTRDTWCQCAQLGGDPHECRFIEPPEATRRALLEAWEGDPERVRDLLEAEIERGPAEFLAGFLEDA